MKESNKYFSGELDSNIQYASIESGIKAHAEEYSFNIESELFNQLTKEQQKLWRKEIEQACISGGEMGVELAKDPRYKENLEAKEVEENKLPNPRFPHLNNIVDKVFGTGNLESLEYEEAEQLVLLAKEELLKDLEVKEVDLKEYYHEFLQKEWFGNSHVRTVSEMMAFTAKHFFELGIKVSNKSIDTTSNIDDLLEEQGVDIYSREAKVIKESFYKAIDNYSSKAQKEE